MLRAIVLLLLAAPLWAQGELAMLGFLVGEHEGKGKHPWGEYTETLVGEWILNNTVLRVRTKSVIKGKTVFEDIRLFSWDAKTKMIRARQYAMGDVLVYDVRVDGKRLIMKLTAHEGGALPDWQYTLVREGENSFSYRVDVPGKTEPYVSGSLKRKALDRRGTGPFAFKMMRTRIGDLAAEVHYPDGKGPFPAIVLSPGGNAGSAAGYGSFGKWFASWGFVTAIVAFNDGGGVERAKKFGDVATWLTKGAMKDRVDATRLVAAGHSRGGFASVIASRTDKRFIACLAFAPSGPKTAPEGKNTPPTFVVVGDRDEFLPTCKQVYGFSPKPRFLVTLPGMGHMFSPPKMGREVAIRATAFLMTIVAKDKAFRPTLLATDDGVKVEND